jgi:hypothetical protein
MERTRSEHLRKMLTGACLIAAPAVFIVSESIHPDDSTNGSDEVRTIASGLDRWYTAHVLEVIGFALLIGAVLGLAHLLHERRPGSAVVGGALAIVGIVGLTAGVGAEGLGGYFIVRYASRADAVRAVDAMYDGARLVPFFAVSLLISVGLVVMAVQLWRTRVVAPWCAIAIIIGSVLLVAGGPTTVQGLVVAGMVALFVGMAPIGYMLLTESDAEWEHTPEFQGFGHRTAAMGT